MAHPYKAASHKNDPQWVKGLETFKEEDKYKAADLAATARNHAINPKVTAQAAYEPLNKKVK